MGNKLHTRHYDFSDRLKGLRKQKYETQSDFAEALNVSIDSVRNWEQGRILPEMETLFKICDLLDCDLDYLTGRIEQKTHDLQYISDYMGLSEETINTLTALPGTQKELLCKMIETKDFVSVMSDISKLSDKDSISNSVSDMIISHIGRSLKNQKSLSPNIDLIEKSMLYSLSTKLTSIICKVTNTDL